MIICTNKIHIKQTKFKLIAKQKLQLKITRGLILFLK